MLRALVLKIDADIALHEMEHIVDNKSSYHVIALNTNTNTNSKCFYNASASTLSALLVPYVLLVL